MSSMDQFWDKRAADDPYHWVMTEKHGWEEDEYYNTGKEHVETLVLPFIREHNKSPSDLSILDIGCGTGRMAKFLADHFHTVIGTDVSKEMIDKAQEDHADLNIEFLVTTGRDLQQIASNSLDVCFSFATLQHVSRKSWVIAHFAEIHRILKDGGHAKIEVRGEPGNPAGKVLWFKGLERMYIALVLWRKIVPLPFFRLYNPLYGACFTEQELNSICTNIGFKGVKTYREGGRHLWVELQK